MTSTVWNISIGQLGLAAWLRSLPAPAHPPLAEHEKLEKVPHFVATPKNISVTNILLVLNPKQSSYWEGN